MCSRLCSGEEVEFIYLTYLFLCFVHATETGISSGLMGPLARKQTLPIFFVSVWDSLANFMQMTCAPGVHDWLLRVPVGIARSFGFETL